MKCRFNTNLSYNISIFRYAIVGTYCCKGEKLEQIILLCIVISIRYKCINNILYVNKYRKILIK